MKLIKWVTGNGNETRASHCLVRQLVTISNSVHARVVF